MAAQIAPLVVLVGETGSGKTKLGIQLAKNFNGEIIAADSRTIYEGMDIGTAKPTAQEQLTVPHHLLDMIKPDQAYSAAQFKQDAVQAIDDIWWHTKLPIMVGGSGLYIDSVLFDYTFAAMDSKRDARNPRHLLKLTTPENISTNLQQLRPNTLVIGLKIDREKLEQKITERVEQMVKNGLVEETKQLVDSYGEACEALNGAGYKQFVEYVRGDISLEEATERAITAHKQLAKRQRTWFKRNKYIHWISDPSEAYTLVKTFLNQTE